MRKITKISINAFLNNVDFKQGNTEVKVYKDRTELLLHGNKIAEKSKYGLGITNCGWFSNTTKERLNGLPNVHIQQVNFEWFLNGVKWDGRFIEIQ